MSGTFSWTEGSTKKLEPYRFRDRNLLASGWFEKIIGNPGEMGVGVGEDIRADRFFILEQCFGI